MNLSPKKMEATPPKTPNFRSFIPQAIGHLGVVTSVLSQKKSGNTFKMPYKSGSRTITKRRPKNVKMSKSLIAKTVRSLQPDKHYAKRNSGAFVHNTGKSLNVTYALVQGVEDDERVADEVYLKSLKLNAYFETPTTAGAYTYRLIVLWTTEEYSNTDFAAQLTKTEVFLPLAGTDNITTNGCVNPKACTVLWDKTYNINSTITGVSDCLSDSGLIRLNQKYKYQSAIGTYGKNRNLMIYCITNVAGGTDNTTSTGGVFVTYDLVFKQ